VLNWFEVTLRALEIEGAAPADTELTFRPRLWFGNSGLVKSTVFFFIELNGCTEPFLVRTPPPGPGEHIDSYRATLWEALLPSLLTRLELGVAPVEDVFKGEVFYKIGKILADRSFCEVGLAEVSFSFDERVCSTSRRWLARLATFLRASLLAEGLLVDDKHGVANMDEALFVVLAAALVVPGMFLLSCGFF